MEFYLVDPNNPSTVAVPKFSTQASIDKPAQGRCLDPFHLSELVSIQVQFRLDEPEPNIGSDASGDVDLAILFDDPDESLDAKSIVAERVQRDLVAYKGPQYPRALTFEGFDHLAIYAPLRDQLEDVLRPLTGSPIADGYQELRSWFVVQQIAKEQRLIDPDAKKGYTALPTGTKNTFVDYTASIVPTSRQEREIKEFVQENETNDSDAAFALFMSPLGPDSRAIADSAFWTGCIDIGTKRELGHHDSRDCGPGDRARRELEMSFYQARCAFNPEATRIIYFPLRVAGVPWMALYVFDDPDLTTGRLDSKHRLAFLASDIVPKIAERAQSAAIDAWLDSAQETIEQALVDLRNRVVTWKSVADRSFDHLARSYPFQQIEATAATELDELQLHCKANEYFGGDVDKTFDELLNGRLQAVLEKLAAQRKADDYRQASDLAERFWIRFNSPESETLHEIADVLAEEQNKVCRGFFDSWRVLDGAWEDLKAEVPSVPAAARREAMLEYLRSVAQPHLFEKASGEEPRVIRLAAGMLIIRLVTRLKSNHGSVSKQDMVRLFNPLPGDTSAESSATQLTWLQSLVKVHESNVLEMNGTLGQAAGRNAQGLSLLGLYGAAKTPARKSMSDRKREDKPLLDETEVELLRVYAASVGLTNRDEWPRFLRKK